MEEARSPLQGALTQRGPTHSEALSKGTKKEGPVYFLSVPFFRDTGQLGLTSGAGTTLEVKKHNLQSTQRCAEGETEDQGKGGIYLKLHRLVKSHGLGSPDPGTLPCPEK